MLFRSSYCITHLSILLLWIIAEPDLFHTPDCGGCFVGSEAKKSCNEKSKTYQDFPCDGYACLEACHKDGFSDGDCFLEIVKPPVASCFCCLIKNM